MKHRSKKIKVHKKRAPMSLKGKLVLYFLLLSAVLLSIIWIFQVVLLDDFYRFIKTEQLENCAKELTECTSEEEIEALALEIKEEHNMGVGVYDTTANIFYRIYSSRDIGDYSMDFLPHQVYGFYGMAKKNGGSITCNASELMPETLANKNPVSQQVSDDRLSEDMVTAVIYGGDEAEYMVMVKTPIAPVSSTIDTLRIQLSMISAVFVLIAIVIAVHAAARISGPLTKTNKAAKELARQNYNVEFKAKGYREIYELADTLNYAAGELSAVDDLRRELIANISHDLRTPLTMIGGYAEVMRDIPGENTSENLQVIIDETEHLSNLVSDLLDLSRLESGNIPLEIEEFCITDTIRSIFSRYTKFTSGDNYKLDFEYSESLWVRGDELRLTQVIYNLINNAMNYSRENREVTVRQSLVEGRVLIEVVDRGEGISPEKLKTIWDRYYRGDEEHKQAVVGTGLGLSIVKNILTLHNARFGVKSKIGEGSTFWFSIEASEPRNLTE